MSDYAEVRVRSRIAAPGHASKLAMTIGAVCCVIATVSVSAQHRVLSGTAPASPPTIDLDDRRILAAGNRTAILGEITIAETTADNGTGDTNPVPANRGRRSEMNLTVSGPLRQGDAIFLDLNENGAPDPGEALRADPFSRVATASYSLDALVPGSRAIRYTPNGNDMMERAEFVVSATVDYGESSQASPDGLSWTTPLKYHGVSTFAVIPLLSGIVDPDYPHIRIECVSGGPSCVVFFECRDQDQDADYFFAELDTIDDKETVRLSQRDLVNADILRVGGGTERLSCHVLSNDPVKVQVLVRVSGPLIPPQRDPNLIYR